MTTEFRELLDQILVKLDTIKYLSLTVEDYFYEHSGDVEYNKNQTVATVTIEKIKELENFIEENYKKERND